MLLRPSLSFGSKFIGLNDFSTEELTVIVYFDFLLTVKINASPCSRLLISQVLSGLDFASSSLNKSVAVYGSTDAVKRGELSLLYRGRLNYPLESELFTMLEGTELYDFVFDVDKDAHSVRLEVFIDVQALTPEEHSLEIALLDEKCFGVFSLQYELVVCKVLDLIIK